MVISLALVFAIVFISFIYSVEGLDKKAKDVNLGVGLVIGALVLKMVIWG